MNQINIQHNQTKIGELILGSFENKLCLLDFKNRENREMIDLRIQDGLNSEFVKKNDKILEKTKKQVDEYLGGERKKFNIPILMIGTDFQKTVWQTLIKIKYGKTVSYLDLAKQIGNKKAVRAVANANNANAIGLIIPCHRVIGSNGKLTGYAGGLSSKRRLLDLENGKLR